MPPNFTLLRNDSFRSLAICLYLRRDGTAILLREQVSSNNMCKSDLEWTHHANEYLIDDKLMEDTLRLTGLKTKREAVEVGLRTLLLMNSLIMIDLCGRGMGILAAKNFRVLRSRGITVRKTIDTVIATRCIENDYSLLYSDRDFDPFLAHLGLRSALA
jgi:hypothetical protein